MLKGRREVVNWYERWSLYIEDNLESFITHFFSTSNQIIKSKSILLNPSPCCGHNDCFSFSKEKNKPFGNCFSCGASGNRIQIAELVWGKSEAYDELEKWTGIKRNQQKRVITPEERHAAKINEIATLVVDLYHHLLMNTEEGEEALQRQIGTDLTKGERGHTEDTLIRRKVGLSIDDFSRVIDMLKKRNYTDEEIEAARKLVWAPPGYYVYPYFSANDTVIRINTKPFRLNCLGKQKKDGSYDFSCGHVLTLPSKTAKKEHEEQTGHVMSPVAYSTGNKDYAIYKDPTIKTKKKYLILVEGENDEMSVSEEILKMGGNVARDFLAVGIGGNIREGFFEIPFFRNFERIYEAFDPDEAGDKYREQLNKELPDIPVYSIHLDDNDAFDDIDQYFKSPHWEGKQSLEDLLQYAEFVDSPHLLFERIQSIDHEWVARNRSFELRFRITKFNHKLDQFEGSLVISAEGKPIDKKSGALDKISVTATYQTAKLQLSNHLDEYYNESKWEKGEPIRRFDDLVDIIRYTKNYQQVCKQVAWYLRKANEASVEDYQRLYTIVRNKVYDQKIIAEILQEVNALTNQDYDYSEPPMPIRLSQHFSVKNNDAFFYFSRVMKDGDEFKMVPCLLTNKQEEIRLDLIQRKDPQSILLVKNKYQLPREVKVAPMQHMEVSLQPYWVDKWKNGEIPDEELEPANIIKMIEEFIGRVYYFPPTRKKVLALWIYATYFYMMFQSGFPYLLFTGEKGTGKSTLDSIIYLLALNAKIALKTSESALYRTIDFEGGTFILDETENLHDKRTVDQSGYATILKGGYSDTAYVYLSDPDQGNATVKFSVFGPKVISNINGIDDVIAERCLFIRTYRVSEEKVSGLEKVDSYRNERRSEPHEISSKCVLSALVHFKQVHEIFENIDGIKTGNLRLNQIIKPLSTIARLVGGDYEEHLAKFYNQEVKGTKEEIAEGSTEGMIKRVLSTVAREVTNVVNDKWATDNSGTHLFEHVIHYDKTLRQFEIDTLQIKLLCEELDTELNLSLKLVKRTLDNILGSKYREAEAKPKRTSIKLINENLIRLFNGKQAVHAYRYLLDVRDFLTPDEFQSIGKENQGPTLF